MTVAVVLLALIAALVVVDAVVTTYAEQRLAKMLQGPLHLARPPLVRLHDPVLLADLARGHLGGLTIQSQSKSITLRTQGIEVSPVALLGGSTATISVGTIQQVLTSAKVTSLAGGALSPGSVAILAATSTFSNVQVQLTHLDVLPRVFAAKAPQAVVAGVHAQANVPQVVVRGLVARQLPALKLQLVPGAVRLFARRVVFGHAFTVQTTGHLAVSPRGLSFVPVSASVDGQADPQLVALAQGGFTVPLPPLPGGLRIVAVAPQQGALEVSLAVAPQLPV